MPVSTGAAETTTESLWRTAAVCFQPKLLRSETLAWISVTTDALQPRITNLFMIMESASWRFLIMYKRLAYSCSKVSRVSPVEIQRQAWGSTVSGPWSRIVWKCPPSYLVVT